MTRYFICTVISIALLTGNPQPVIAGAHHSSGLAINSQEDGLVKLPLSAKSPLPAEKAHHHVPSWDELAHIHNFHKDRMKKMKRHYRKSVLVSKLLLLLVHAAILLVSYLHAVH